MTKELTTRGQATLPGLAPDREARERIDDLVAFWPDTGPVELRRAITVDDKRVLDRRLRELNVALRPIELAMADRERAAMSIGVMFAAMPSMRNVDAEGMTAAFLVFLDKLPIFAIEQACRDIGEGKVPGVDPSFPVNSGQLAERARHVASPLEVERANIERALGGEVMRRPEPAEAKRIGENLQRFGADLHAETDKIRDDLIVKQGKADRARNERLMLGEYAHLGVKPRYAGDMLISPTLAKKLGAI